MFFRKYSKFSIRFAHGFRGFLNLYNFQNALVLYNSFGEKGWGRRTTHRGMATLVKIENEPPWERRRTTHRGMATFRPTSNPSKKYFCRRTTHRGMATFIVM